MLMNLPEKYINDLTVRLSHHSTALEGNTLTLDETKDLLMFNTTPARSVDVREIYEIKSNARALKEVLKSMATNEPFSEMIILRMHYFIGESTVTFPGEYKKVNNYIQGSDFETTPASKVAYAMQQWLDEVKNSLEFSTEQAFFEGVAKSHIEFEKIHPFSDGNGRTGRMIMLYLCFKKGYLPPVIPVGDKKKYLDFLRKEDAVGLGAWLKELSDKEQLRFEGFRGF